jgi:uncharacterized protein (TIGR02266 family)
MSAKDNRRDPRAKILSLTVRYKSATVSDFIENHSHDVSRGGLFIKTQAPFPAGTLLKFEVRIAEEQTLIDGVGRVAWRRERDRGDAKPAGMGVKFIKIADDSVALIERSMEARGGQASQFEEGAAEAGLRLSDPPPNLLPTGAAKQPMFPAGADRPPAEATDSSMLLQSSELLKAAIGNLRLEDAGNLGAALEDRVTLPTGISTADGSAASGDDEESEADGEEEDDDDDDDDASESLPAGPLDSKRPKAKREKKRNPKKKKAKFRYASLPAPKPPTPRESQPAASAVAPSSRRKSTSQQPTTAPTRRKAAVKQASTTWWWLGGVAVIAAGIGAFVYSEQLKTPTEPAIAAAVPVTLPSALPQAPEPTQVRVVPSAEPG